MSFMLGNVRGVRRRILMQRRNEMKAVETAMQPAVNDTNSVQEISLSDISNVVIERPVNNEEELAEPVMTQNPELHETVSENKSILERLNANAEVEESIEISNLHEDDQQSVTVPEIDNFSSEISAEQTVDISGSNLEQSSKKAKKSKKGKKKKKVGE
jgi:hypothetical protein